MSAQAGSKQMRGVDGNSSAKLAAKELLALPWSKVANIVRVPLASTTSHVDFKIDYPTPPLLGETVDLHVSLTSNEDEVSWGMYFICCSSCRFISVGAGRI